MINKTHGHDMASVTLDQSTSLIKSFPCIRAFSVLVFLVGFALPLHASSNTSYIYATVLEAEPIIRVINRSTPRESCWEQQVVLREQRPTSATGAVLGGIIGAAIGNELGHHKSNKRVGAVAGAVLGSTIGQDVGRAHAGTGHERLVTEQRCKTVYESYEEERITGYDVVYRYNGANYQTKTRQHPGDTLKLKVSITPVPF